MYLIAHETSPSNLLQILKSGVLFKGSEVQKRNISFGQGSAKRRLTEDPEVSLTDKNFGDKFDEVDGVYFRIFKVTDKIQTCFGECLMVFDKDILTSARFVINTEENFGFQLAPNGQEGESQFSGEIGMTITEIEDLPRLEHYHFNPHSSELLIRDNVNIKPYIKTVFVKKQNQTEELIDVCRQLKIQIFTL